MIYKNSEVEVEVDLKGQRRKEEGEKSARTSKKNVETQMDKQVTVKETQEIFEKLMAAQREKEAEGSKKNVETQMDKQVTVRKIKKIFEKLIEETKKIFEKLRRSKENVEETPQMSKLVMVGEIKNIYDQIMARIKGFLDSDERVLPFYIKGPTGVGKTSLVYYMAKELDIPLVLAQCNQAQDYHELLGYQKITHRWFWTTTQFVDGPVLKAIKTANKNGVCILLLDEVNGLAPEAQKLVNPLLDGRDMVNYGEIVAKVGRGKKLIVIGTANELKSGYYGIVPLNQDLERRLKDAYILPYPKPDEEFKIVCGMTDENTEESNIITVTIKAAIKLANHTRGDWGGPSISPPMLIEFIKIFKIYEQYNIPNALMEAFKASIVNHFDEELREALIEKAKDVGLIPM